MAKQTKQPDWVTNPPFDFQERVLLLEKYQAYLESPGPKGQTLREILRKVEQDAAQAEQEQRRMCPPAFFIPSYEQALMLNAWMYGIEFICAYTSNRIGKTTAMIINFILWVFPNDPNWLIFQPYTDKHGRHVQVFPRPSFPNIRKIRLTIQSLSLQTDPDQAPHHPINRAALQALQNHPDTIDSYAPAFPRPPWNRGGTAWTGAPDAAHHQQIMMPLWLNYLPSSAVTRVAYKDKEISLQITPSEGPPVVWELIGKSYESEDTKWASGAVDAILLTEGITLSIFKEIKLRFGDPSFGGHDFTPFDPANSSGASGLAYHLYKRDNSDMMWPKSYHVFTRFKVALAPNWIISDDKREAMLKAYANDPEGAARIEGEFYTSSGLVLNHLNRKHHMLDWSIDQLFERYPDARIYRSIDPGYDHPAVCAWGALLPINVWVIFRIYVKRGTTIPERCKDIIHASHNEQKVVQIQHGLSRIDEVQSSVKSEWVEATIMDYHAFAADQTTGLSNSHNYVLQGLQVIQSITAGPADRASTLNDALQVKEGQPHPMGPTENPLGAARIYFLKKGLGVLEAITKWENFFWERFKSGDNKGLPKDKIPEHGDDELDAVSYLVCSPFRWTNFTRFGNMSARGLIQLPPSSDKVYDTERWEDEEED